MIKNGKHYKKCIKIGKYKNKNHFQDGNNI